LSPKKLFFEGRGDIFFFLLSYAVKFSRVSGVEKKKVFGMEPTRRKSRG